MSEVTLTQAEVNEKSQAAARRYGGLSARAARLFFIYELQGFVASEVARGRAIDMDLEDLEDLIAMCGSANGVGRAGDGR